MKKRVFGVAVILVLLLFVSISVQAEEVLIDEVSVIDNGQITPNGIAINLTEDMFKDVEAIQKVAGISAVPQNVHDDVFVKPPMVRGTNVGLSVNFSVANFSKLPCEEGHTLVTVGLGASVADYKGAKNMFTDFKTMTQEGFKAKNWGKLLTSQKGSSGDFGGQVFLYMYFDKDNNLIDGEFGLLIKASIGYTYPFPFPLSFLYLKGEVGLTASFSLYIGDDADGRLLFKGKLLFEPYAEGGVGAGGWVAHLEGGINAKLPIDFQIPFGRSVPLSQRMGVNFNSAVYAEVKFLLFTKRWSYTWAQCSLYPNARCKLFAKGLQAKSGDGFEMIQRCYLETAGAFAEGSVAKALSKDGLSTKEVLKSSVMPISETKLLPLGSGKEMLLWLDDEAERTAENRSALYYSIKDENGWGTAKIVADDNTFDSDFDAVYKDGKVHIVWLDISRSIEPGATVEEMAGLTDVFFISYDVANKTFSDEVKLSTAEAGLESRPVLALSDNSDEMSVIWLLNTAADYETEEGTNKLLISKFDGATWSSASSCYETTDVFGSYDMDYVDGNRTLFFSKQTGLRQVDEDQEKLFNLFRIDGDSEAVQFTNDEINNTYPLLRTEDNAMVLYWQTNESLKRQNLSATSSAAEVISEKVDAIRGFDVLGQDEDRMILWEKPENWTTVVGAVFRDKTEWGEPVTLLSGSDGSLDGLSAILDQSGELHLTALTAPIAAADFITEGLDANETFYGNYDLIYGTIEPDTYDLAIVGDVNHDYETVKDNGKARLIINLANNGNEALEKVKVSFTGNSALAGINVPPAQFVPVNLASGEEGTIEVDYQLPAEMDQGEIGIDVQPASAMDEVLSEFNQTNNSDELMLGSAVLAIDDMSVENNGSTTHITVQVSNSGFDDSDPVTLILRDYDDTTEIIRKDVGFIPAESFRSYTFDVPTSCFSFDGKGNAAVAYMQMETHGEDISAADSYAELVPYIQIPAFGLQFFTIPGWYKEGLQLPGTGFSTHHEVKLSVKPASIKYSRTGVNLQIPVIDLQSDVVMMPRYENGWADKWLGSDIGMLEGSEVVGEGISWFAGHNHLNENESGPFALIGKLALGDKAFVTMADGSLKEYSVSMNKLYAADGFEAIFDDLADESEGVVLMTCENETLDGGYSDRRVVFISPVA